MSEDLLSLLGLCVPLGDGRTTRDPHRRGLHAFLDLALFEGNVDEIFRLSAELEELDEVRWEAAWSATFN